MKKNLKEKIQEEKKRSNVDPSVLERDSERSSTQAQPQIDWSAEIEALKSKGPISIEQAYRFYSISGRLKSKYTKGAA